MTTVTLPINLVQAVADYLSMRPYREVAALLEALMKASAPPTDAAPAADPAP